MLNAEFASKSEKEKRLSYCRVCEHNKIGVCSKCGCILGLKTQWKGTKCPVGKWGPEAP